MKYLGLLLCCTPLIAQTFSAGVKGGVPITTTADTAQENFRYGGRTSFRMNRYAVGPTVELALPLHLRFEFDALYRHARLDRRSGPAPTATLDYSATRADIWEFPLLLKYRTRVAAVEPYFVAGSTLRSIGDVDVDLISVPTFPGYTTTRRSYTMDSGEPVRAGITVGVGVRRKLGILHLEPELRYVHWTAKHWMATTEQLDVMLGITFP